MLEVLQDTQDMLQDESNATEIEIDSIENNITKTTQDIDAYIADESHDEVNGTIASSETNDKETADISILEKEIAELEKKVKEIEEQNIEEEEMGEITDGAAEYYAEVAQEAMNETQATQEENKELAKDVDYYAEVIEEVEEENEALEDANEYVSEENEILQEEVEDIVDYYEGKEGNETNTEEIITITYYPVNGTNTTGDYYVYETEETVIINDTTEFNEDAGSEYMPYVDDFGAMDDGMFGYSFEDDFFEDAYWAYDWDSAWGDYACSDLFDTDLEGLSYEEDLPPGDDEWPYVTIFGSCNSCKAFLVDYYSTEHFERIKQYEKQALSYMSYGMVGLFITGILILKQWLKPAEENQVDLLMNYGRNFV
jgi:Chromosome segregation ATPases